MKKVYYQVWKLDANDNEYIAFEYCETVLQLQYGGNVAEMGADAYAWENAKIVDLTK